MSNNYEDDIVSHLKKDKIYDIELKSVNHINSTVILSPSMSVSF